MKNKIAAVLFLLLLNQAAAASKIKALAGINSGKYLFSGEIDSLNRQQKMGFAMGLGWAFSFNQNMELEINAIYSQQGAKAAITYTPDLTVSGFYMNSAIAFPILCKYRLKAKASPYAALGPEMVFIVAHSFKIPESGEKMDLLDNTRKFVLGFNVLLGYEWPFGQWGLFAEVRYNRRLGNFLIDSETKVKSESFTFLLGGIYYL